MADDSYIAFTAIAPAATASTNITSTAPASNTSTTSTHPHSITLSDGSAQHHLRCLCRAYKKSCNGRHSSTLPSVLIHH